MGEKEEEEEVGETQTPFGKRKKSKMKETKEAKTCQGDSEEDPSTSPLSSLVSSPKWATRCARASKEKRDGGFCLPLEGLECG